MYELRGDHQRLQEAQAQVTLKSPGSMALLGGLLLDLPVTQLPYQH